MTQYNPVALALELVAGDSNGRTVADLKERADELEKARNAIVDSTRAAGPPMAQSGHSGCNHW